MRATLPVLLVVLATAAVLGVRSSSQRPYAIAAAGWWNVVGGSMSFRAIQLAVEEINETGGVRGRPLELRVWADSGRASAAVAAAQEIVADRDIIGVIGHGNSSATAAALPVYEGRVPVIVPGTNATSLRRGSSWSFRANAADSAYGAAAAAYASARDWDRAVVLYEDSDRARSTAEAFVAAFAGDVLAWDPISSFRSSENPPLLAFLREHRPDVVFIMASGINIKPAIRLALAADVPLRFLGTDPIVTSVMDSTIEAPVFAVLPEVTESVRTANFVRRYRARYGATPNIHAYLAYDATRALAYAIERAGHRPEDVRREIASWNELSAPIGFTGPVHFDGLGDRAHLQFGIYRGAAGDLVRVNE